MSRDRVGQQAARHDLELAEFIVANTPRWIAEHGGARPWVANGRFESEDVAIQAARTGLTLSFLRGYNAARHDVDYPEVGLRRRRVEIEEARLRGDPVPSFSEESAFVLGMMRGHDDLGAEILAARRKPSDVVVNPRPSRPIGRPDQRPPPGVGQQGDPLFEPGGLFGARASDLETTPIGVVATGAIATAPLWVPVLLLPWLRRRERLRA